MVKHTGPSGELAVFRSRPHQEPSILEGFFWSRVVPSLSPPNRKEVP